MVRCFDSCTRCEICKIVLESLSLPGFCLGVRSDRGAQKTWILPARRLRVSRMRPLLTYSRGAAESSFAISSVSMN